MTTTHGGASERVDLDGVTVTGLRDYLRRHDLGLDWSRNATTCTSRLDLVDTRTGRREIVAEIDDSTMIAAGHEWSVDLRALSAAAMDLLAARARGLEVSP